MSGDWVWAKTGGNSWSVQRAEPPVETGLLSQWNPFRPAALPSALAQHGTSCPLAQAIANQNIWAYLGGMDGKP